MHHTTSQTYKSSSNHHCVVFAISLKIMHVLCRFAIRGPVRLCLQQISSHSSSSSIYAVRDSSVTPSKSDSNSHYARSLTILPRTRIREHCSGTAVFACSRGQARLEIMDHPGQHPGTGLRYVLYPGRMLTVQNRSFYFLGHEVDECELQCVFVEESILSQRPVSWMCAISELWRVSALCHLFPKCIYEAELSVDLTH